MKAWLAFVIFLAGASAYADGEVSVTLAQAHRVVLVPMLSLAHESLSYGDASPFAGHESANGVELGLRALSSSTKSRNFFAGLDLRQSFLKSAGAPQGDFSGTKLGIRLEFYPRIQVPFGFSFNWFFGDTLVARHHDIQYNGSTFAIGASIAMWQMRWFTEATMGSYHEGPGFILRSREAGIESLESWGVKIGVEIPIEVPMPSLFASGPPEV